MKKIIVIEDNRSDYELVELALRQAGLTHRVASIADGKQGLAYVSVLERCQETCLFILDVNLPFHSGREVLHAIKQGHCDGIPVIMMTTAARPEDTLLENVYYFQKPLDLDEFLKIGSFASEIIAGSPAN
jgi:CheY-like chemotaxis protein